MKVIDLPAKHGCSTHLMLQAEPLAVGMCRARLSKPAGTVFSRFSVPAAYIAAQQSVATWPLPPCFCSLRHGPSAARPLADDRDAAGRTPRSSGSAPRPPPPCFCSLRHGPSAARPLADDRGSLRYGASAARPLADDRDATGRTPRSSGSALPGRLREKA